MKEDGGKLLDEGGLEAEDVEENDVNSRRGPRRGLRRIGEDARRGKGRMSRKAREVVGEGWVSVRYRNWIVGWADCGQGRA